VYVLVVAQSSSEVPEGLMNNPVDPRLVTRTDRITVVKETSSYNLRIFISNCF